MKIHNVARVLFVCIVLFCDFGVCTEIDRLFRDGHSHGDESRL